MAAAVGTEVVNIVVNDVDIQVPKGELIVEAVKRLGLEIPIFCYHPRMKPVGMCRMCLVEVGFKQPDGTVRKMPKPQAACTLPASEGMVIYTDSEMVHRDRQGVIEFLLINHPLDCPICDRGGECPLQNNTIFHGHGKSRFIEAKRHANKAFRLSEYVTLDLERCIQCGRCVRFTEEISGDAQLAFRFRGSGMQPSTFQLTEFNSKFSGNVIEICPVGALTSGKYRFQARPWDLETKPGICVECSNHCSVWVDHRANKIARINGRTNEAVNEEWTCDKGKFGHEYYNDPKRLTQPLVREGDRFVPTTWAKAYEVILQNADSTTAALVGSAISNEGLYLLQKLLRSLGSKSVDYRWTKCLPKDAGYSNPTAIADIENAKAIVVLGANLAETQPMVYLRARKAWFKNGARVIVAHSGPTDCDSFADVLVNYRAGGLSDFAAALAGKDESASKRAGADHQAVLKLAEALSQEGTIVLSSASIYNEPDAIAAVGSLRVSAGTSPFNIYAERGNDQGAAMLGLSGEGLDTHAILRAAALSEVRSLWLVGADPIELHPSTRLAEDALEGVPFLVYQGVTESPAMKYASVVLPMEAPAESEGTYTNIEGRVQRMGQVVAAPGDAKQAWRIFAELLLRKNPGVPYFGPKEVMAEIAKVVPAFKDATYDKLPAEGHQLKPAQEEIHP